MQQRGSVWHNPDNAVFTNMAVSLHSCKIFCLHCPFKMKYHLQLFLLVIYSGFISHAPDLMQMMTWSSLSAPSCLCWEWWKRRSKTFAPTNGEQNFMQIGSCALWLEKLEKVSVLLYGRPWSRRGGGGGGRFSTNIWAWVGFWKFETLALLIGQKKS